LVILGLIIVLLVVGFLLLSSGGTEPGALTTVTSTPRPRASATPTFTPSATPTPVPRTDESFEGKDPFQPLVTPQVPSGGDGTGSTPAPTSTANTTGGTQSQRVSLDDIFREGGERFATVSVDGNQFTVQQGDTFDGSFKLLTLDASCGTFVFGDERFTLCLGQEVRK